MRCQLTTSPWVGLCKACISAPSARHLAAVVQRSVPMLRHLERVVHPRWPTPVEATKRLVGAVVVILSVGVHSDTPEQRHSRFGDCLDRACLYRGRRVAAFDRLACCRYCADAGDGCRMGDAGWRKMVHRFLVMNCVGGRRHRTSRSAQSLYCKGRALGLGQQSDGTPFTRFRSYSKLFGMISAELFVFEGDS